MALTPSQMGTKSRTLTSPSTNIRSRPNGLGRSPRMGRVQQVSPYQVGELVETPMGLRRIMGISPFTMNIDLGPRGELTAKAISGATTISVKNFNKSVSFDVGDLLIVGGTTDSFRETVKIGTAVTISSSTVSVSLSTALKNSHRAGVLVVSQKLPPDYDGEFIEVEELRILGDDKYAYVIPSVPKQPRYISRTGAFGGDDAKDQLSPTNLDVTDNFTRYESVPIDFIRSALTWTFTGSIPMDVGLQLYRMYMLGYNNDGTARPSHDSIGDQSEEYRINRDATITGDPMFINATLLENGTADKIAIYTKWRLSQGAYTYSTGDEEQLHFFQFLIPTYFQQGVAEAIRALEWSNLIVTNWFLLQGDGVQMGFLPYVEGGDTGYSVALGFGATTLDIDFFSADAEGTAASNFAAYNAVPNPYKIFQRQQGISPGTFEANNYFQSTTNEGGDSVQAAFMYLVPTSSTPTDERIASQRPAMEQISGTASGSDSSANITGVGTSFTSQLSATAGKRTRIVRFEGSSTNYTIQSITNDGALVLTGNAGHNFSGAKIFVVDFVDQVLSRSDFLLYDAEKALAQRAEFRGTSTTSSDKSGQISQRVFLQLPQGQTRWAAKKALDSGKNENTGFIDAFQSPEDSPNETFSFYVGKNEESLPYMKASNKTGETLLDGRVKISGYIINAPRVKAEELKKIHQRAGYYKAKLLPHSGYFPNLDDRPDGPPDGWEPRSRRQKRNLLESLRALSADVKKEMRGG